VSENLAAEAEKKLTPEELQALRDKHIEEFTTWCVEDLERISPEWRHKRNLLIAYYRIIWLGVQDPRQAHIDELEVKVIRMLRDEYKLSMDEIAFVTGRSKSTIHHHLLDPIPDRPLTPVI
jgi:hypothetical protein